MMRHKRLKGFTLIELIIVMAIFGVIMAAAIGLMDPVSKIFRSTAQYEQTRAAVDNTQRYLNGTLRYADRFAMYYTCNDGCGTNYSDFSNIDDNVANFAGKYFYCEDKSSSLVNGDIDTPVYVLVFDNENYTITKRTYKPSTNWISSLSYDGTSSSYSIGSTSYTSTDVVNDALLSDYSFQIYLGSYEYVANAAGDYALSRQDYNDKYYPTLSNLSFTIIGYKNGTADDGAGGTTITRTALNQSSTLSLSLVNLIDANTVNSLSSIAVSKTDNQMYYDATNKCFNYVYGDDGIARGNIYPDTTHPIDAQGNFYIIYTLPDRADEYVAANKNNSYNYEVTTAATTS
jgi:prepilin-type N-terminal cleavage/methylation domain-containing protein